MNRQPNVVSAICGSRAKALVLLGITKGALDILSTPQAIKRVKKDGEETLRFYSREEAAALVAAVQHHPVRLAVEHLA